MARNPMAELAALIAAKHKPSAKPLPKKRLEPDLIPRLELGRCERMKISIHAQTFKRIWLQCVEDPGHKGACLYENPSNQRKKRKHYG
jgi:hypothetical protein